VPRTPDSPDSRSPDRHRANLLVVLVCGLGLAALLIGGVSLLVHKAVEGPSFPYQVAFSQVGTACNEEGESGIEGLVLDRETGEILYCQRLPGFGGVPAGTGGNFSGPETARVTALAKSLASEDGLSDADQREVERLATEIGRKHGYEPPTLTERVTGTVGPWGIGLGLALLIGLGLWAHFTEDP